MSRSLSSQLNYVCTSSSPPSSQGPSQSAFAASDLVLRQVNLDIHILLHHNPLPWQPLLLQLPVHQLQRHKLILLTTPIRIRQQAKPMTAMAPARGAHSSPHSGSVIGERRVESVGVFGDASVRIGVVVFCEGGIGGAAEGAETEGRADGFED